ncbi:MAG: hypothetical protein AAB091_03285 [Elusimicrobiota bacterium]
MSPEKTNENEAIEYGVPGILLERKTKKPEIWQQWVVVKTLGAGAPGDEAHGFNSPQGYGLDKAGNRLYVADAGNGRVQIFDIHNWKLIKSLGAEMGLKRPRAAGFDPQGFLFIIDDAANSAYILDGDAGKLQETLQLSEIPDGSSRFVITGVARDALGRNYVINSDQHIIDAGGILADLVSHKLKTLARPEEWAGALDDIEALVAFNPAFAPWIFESRSAEQLHDLKKISSLLKNLSALRVKQLLSQTPRSQDFHNFLKQIRPEELAVRARLENIFNPDRVTAASLDLLDNRLAVRAIARKRDHLRALWGSIQLAKDRHVSPENLEKIFASLAKRNIRQARYSLQSMAYAAPYFREGFNLNSLIAKSAELHGRISWPYLWDAWRKHLLAKLSIKLGFVKDKNAALQDHISRYPDFWIENDFLNDILLYAVSLNENGLKTLETLLVELSQSMIGSDGKTIIYNQRYSYLRDHFHAHPEVLKAWQKNLKHEQGGTTIEITDDPKALLTLGDIPITTCLSYRSHRPETASGQLVNFMRFGQFKLANVYSKGELAANVILELGFNDTGEPALFVERLYAGETINLLEVEEALIQYGRTLGVKTLYWGTKQDTFLWNLTDRPIKEREYRLIAAPGGIIYRESFGKTPKIKALDLNSGDTMLNSSELSIVSPEKTPNKTTTILLALALGATTLLWPGAALAAVSLLDLLPFNNTQTK